MKTFSEIYDNIKTVFKKKTNIDIIEGTVLDSFLVAVSDSLLTAHEEIENSKNPHIYTNLKGTNIDKLGLLINCPRRANESDESYLYRCMNWTYNNESCNKTAISSALSNLEYATIATYIPFTQGTGTASVYIIPKEYTDEIQEKALSEVSNRLKNVISPDTYIKYIITESIQVKLSCYITIDENYDMSAIKLNIENNIKKYINSIAIGDFLSYGDINKIGINEPGVTYFNTTHIYLDGILLSALKQLQKVDSKFLYYDIVWNEGGE